MYKKEVFDTILSIVSEETGIGKNLIASPCKVTEVVDARYIFVNLLYWAGLYPPEIASMIGVTRRSVNIIISKFENRKRFCIMMRINYENIKNQVRKYF